MSVKQKIIKDFFKTAGSKRVSTESNNQVLLYLIQFIYYSLYIFY
jgi:hypothetical protein